jgi:PEGA domain
MSNEQRIRAVLFYLSITVFFAGLPLILSFSLGYKFNPRTFKFTKTGIISLKTQPQGASVYLDGKLLNEKTPATIAELLPGSYSVRLELKRHYPWVSQVNVEPRKVERFEKIILFPKRSNIKQLNQDRVTHFWMDKEEGKLYYFNQDENILYKSNLDGDRFEEIGSIPEEFSLPPKEIKISPDRQKMLIFNGHQISVIALKPKEESAYMGAPVILYFPGKYIHNVFWHSDSYHLILVTDRNIEVLESEDKPNPVNLVSLSKRAPEVFYDTDKGTLYFMDSQRGADGGYYDNVYRLELSGKEYLLNNLMNLRQNAKE